MKLKLPIADCRWPIEKSKGERATLPIENRKSKITSGFTLIEIMVAVAIFSIIIAAIYTTWFLVLKASKSGEDAAAQAQRERIAVRTIEDSLQCIQSFQASMAYYSFIVQNTDSGGTPTLSFVARVPEVFPRNGKFGDFNVRRLTFAVEPNKNDGQENDLVLRQNPILMDMDSDEQNYPLVLARKVKDFVIECWDTNAMDWVTQWDDTNSIPPILRITLSMGGNTDSSKAETTITREISIESSSVPTVAQIPGRGNGGGGNAGGLNIGGANQNGGANQGGGGGPNPNGGRNNRGGNQNGGNTGGFNPNGGNGGNNFNGGRRGGGRGGRGGGG